MASRPGMGSKPSMAGSSAGLEEVVKPEPLQCVRGRGGGRGSRGKGGKGKQLSASTAPIKE